MSKEKRKGRLNKGQSGEFIGFGAFAKTDSPLLPTTFSAAVTSAANDAAMATSVSHTPQSPPSSSASAITAAAASPGSSTLSPIYLGPDPSLGVLFPRIGQKRDATTKAKALTDLVAYFDDTSQLKKNQAEALAHFLYLYQSKLQYDNAPRIRALCVQVCDAAIRRVPKAWRTLVVGGGPTDAPITPSTAADPAVAASGVDRPGDDGSSSSTIGNGTINSNVDILGTLLCARADQASEVRIAANAVVVPMLSTNGNVDDDDTSELPNCYRGMWKYVERILSYGKPTAMHLDLFQRGTAASGSRDAPVSLSERQQEELDERYERIVGTALEGLQLFLQEPSIVSLMTAAHGKVDPSNGHAAATTIEKMTPDSVKFLWKTLSSNKAPLRRKTYALMSTICQKLPFLLENDKTSKLLLQSLSAEKESSNVGPLLETLLAFIASIPKDEQPLAGQQQQQQQQQQLPSTRRETMAQYAKALTKLFKRGCLGASAAQWTPMVLPIVALLPSEGVTAPQAGVLASVWEGRTHVVGVADSLLVIQAVAETSAFLLVQQSPQDLDEVTAQCWIRCLDAYLAANSTLVGPSLKVHDGTLKATLAKGWVQLEKACRTKPQSAIFALREWFWNEPDQVTNTVMAIETAAGHKNLTSLLTEIKNIETSSIVEESSTTMDSASTMYTSLLAKTFQCILLPGPTSEVESTNIWVPTTDVYELGIAILQLVPGQSIFGNEESQSKFVMNQILQWTVLHTSSISKQVSKQLALLDLDLFHSLFRGVRGTSSSAVNISARQAWETLLREVILARPDLQILSDCLVSLWGLGWTATDLRTNELSDLCIQTAQMAISDAKETVTSSHHHHDDSESDVTEILPDEEYVKEAIFLKGCVGLGMTIRESLVGDTVVEALVNAACPTENTVEISANPVLDTIVAMIENDKLLPSHPFVLAALTQSWRQGGRVWNDRVLSWLVESDRQNASSSFLVDRASKELKGWLDQMVSSSDYDDSRAWIWVERAYRLLDLCQSIDSDDSNIPLPSLTLVGLGDISLWEQGPNLYLSQCFIRLIRYLERPRRWRAITDSDTDSLNLLVSILVNLSGGSPNFLEADLARRREDGCAILLSELAFSELGKDLHLDACFTCVEYLSFFMKETGGEQAKACKIIAVLSQLVSARFPALTPAATIASANGKLQASDVQVGDKIIYITRDDNKKEELCTVIKVHKDLPGELYFTIRLNRNGSLHERQTVLDRLRKADLTASDDQTVREGSTRIDEVDAEEKDLRDRLVVNLLNEVVVPTVGAWRDLYYEIYNIVITQCGLLNGRGIGSVHYSVLQKMLEMQQEIQPLLSSPNPDNDQIASCFWRLSLALGFGINAPSSPWGISLLGLNSSDSVPYVLSYFQDTDKVSTTEIDCAVTAWLSVCAPHCQDVELRHHTFSKLFQIAARLFKESNHGFSPSHAIALRAVEVGQLESHKAGKGASTLQDSEAEALTELVKAFSSTWTDIESIASPSSIADPSAGPSWQSLPTFKSVMEASINERPQFLSIACRQCLDGLTRCLYSPSKRWYAMQVLETYSSSDQPLHESNGEDDIINSKSLARLEQWSKDLLEEEAADLEDDMATIAQWMCKEQMNDVEAWHDDDNINDNNACGRMLSWLSTLQIVDAASGKESINRPAFTSYISRSETVNAMLDLALIYGNIGTERKAKFDTLVALETILKSHINHGRQHEDSSSLDLSKLATLVIFRTIEVFPTLAKNWWEMSCPKYLTQTVRDFVETQVSPEILKRAIESIKNASAFGEMQVKGSSMSREVTAMYVQDDFTLSVVVKLPLSFPFRRAEVDCSKTLGIPESRWKRWSLQITQMLNNQGGTLKDALLLWKENVDKEFEGVEPCPVCYSVLHVKSHKLPSLECKTCHNCFHSDCLFEWFKSSGKSACVICQQPWSGIRV